MGRGHASVFTADERAAVGLAVRVERESAGYNRAQFAEATGMSESFLSAVELGRRAPSQERLADVCRVLKMEPAQLYDLAGRQHEKLRQIKSIKTAFEEGEKVTTGYEVKMYSDISTIARCLNRIANCLEAAEMRARAQDSEPPPEDAQQ